MEQIKILFFVLTSFFGIENGQIAADKTTITVYPETHKIEIIQENLFTVIQSDTNKTIVLEQWETLLNWKEKEVSWSKELDNFTDKNLTFVTDNIGYTIKPHVSLTFSNEKDLRSLGIWYDAEKNQFSINQIPKYNIKTKDGKLEDNYWVFNGDNNFSFTIEPFLEMPENYQNLKKYLKEL